MPDITIHQLEAAINYWRTRAPAVGEELRLCREAGALSKPYALMILQRQTTLALEELEPAAAAAYAAFVQDAGG
ncbi:MAG: DUF3717 domain-containing protein [Janthinobacterium lividum]